MLRKAKLKSGYVFTFKVDAHDARVDVVIGNNIINVEEEYISFLKKRGITILEELDESEPNTAGGVIYYSTSTGIIHTVYFDARYMDDRLIVHEAFHLTFSILRIRGTIFNKKSEETYAYLIDNLFGIIKVIESKVIEIETLKALKKGYTKG
jgi:hypothetical protein